MAAAKAKTANEKQEAAAAKGAAKAKDEVKAATAAAAEPAEEPAEEKPPMTLEQKVDYLAKRLGVDLGNPVG